MSLQTPTPTADLRAAHLALVDAEPRLRARDAAERLGVSEAQLLASHEGATHLRPAFVELLTALPSLGPVMALTRNPSAVHEKRGVYPAPSFDGQVGLFHSPAIDLRVFLRAWHAAFALVEPHRGKLRRSLQFFDAQGEALHKVWLGDGSDVDAFDTIVRSYRSDLPYAPGPARAAPTPAPLPTPEEVAAFLDAWRKLQDTHDFFPLLRRFHLDRLQALTFATEELAVPLRPAVAKDVIERAAAEGQPIMVFVGNRGMVQIHAGPVRQTKELGPWMNVLDPDFNLHLRLDHVAEAWRVTKPTVDGDVHSIELFDDAGELIAQFFGDRKPGVPESEGWRALVRSLEEAHRG